MGSADSCEIATGSAEEASAGTAEEEAAGTAEEEAAGCGRSAVPGACVAWWSRSPQHSTSRAEPIEVSGAAPRGRKLELKSHGKL